MGGAIITIHDPDKKVVEKRLANRSKEGKHLGLVEERAKVVQYDPETKEWVGLIWLHS